MDGSMGGDYRFVTVGVPGQDDVSIVLHKPNEGYDGVRSNIDGFLFHTDDCRKEIERLRRASVKIALEPEEQPRGIQAVFEDLYGNTRLGGAERSLVNHRPGEFSTNRGWRRGHERSEGSD